MKGTLQGLGCDSKSSNKDITRFFFSFFFSFHASPLRTLFLTLPCCFFIYSGSNGPTDAIRKLPPNLLELGYSHDAEIRAYLSNLLV